MIPPIIRMAIFNNDDAAITAIGVEEGTNTVARTGGSGAMTVSRRPFQPG